MSLLPLLLKFIQPLRCCAGLVIGRCGVIAGASFGILAVLKVIFERVVVDNREGSVKLPQKEDVIVFGVLSYLFLRSTVFNAVFARLRPSWTPNVHPLVGYCVLNGIVYVGSTGIWIYLPTITPTASDFTKLLVPIYVTLMCMVSVYNLELNATFKSVAVYFSTIIVFQIIITMQLVIATTCLTLSNQRNKSYLADLVNTDGHAKVYTGQDLLTAFYIGVIYPLVKFAVTALNTLAFAFTSPSIPKTRQDEILVNIIDFTNITGLNLFWDTVGYLLILRNPSYTIFFISLITTQLYNILCYVFFALFIRRNERLKVHAQKQNLEKQEMKLSTARGDEVKMVYAEGFAQGVLEKKAFETMARRTSDGIKWVLDRRRSSVVQKQGGQVKPFQETDCPSHDPSSHILSPSLDKVSEIHSDTKSTQDDEWHYSMTSLPRHSLSTSSVVVDTAPQDTPPPEPPPFTPLAAPVKYTFLRIGMLTSNWCCYLVSTLLILLFTTLPDAPRWSGAFFTVPPVTLFIRVVSGAVVCVGMDGVGLFVESGILGVGFEMGVEEAKVTILSVGAYAHLVGLVCAVLGPFVIAEVGVMEISETFLGGRRRW
ncbi:hypothetical protein BC829DRAFT_388821 [Chytridium lagenaria]|nr:hypothetical protein BC829DRAFT_388821 [Chytridium lagenaria]